MPAPEVASGHALGTYHKFGPTAGDVVTWSWARTRFSRPGIPQLCSSIGPDLDASGSTSSMIDGAARNGSDNGTDDQMAGLKARPQRFIVLVYRMPAKPTAGRVAVWRLLKKAGAIYLQQSVCVFPATGGIPKDLTQILKRIDGAGGEYHLLPVRQPPPAEVDKLVTQFQQQTAKHYEEIIENCEINFTKEIEFETFRKNFTYEEAEEIRAEFEKIVQWYERVRARDWFGAPKRAEAHAWLKKCERLLETFEEQVYASQQGGSEELTVPQPTRRPRSVRAVPTIGRKDGPNVAPRKHQT